MRLKMTALSLIVITAQVASVAAQTSPDSAPGAISGPPGIALPLKSGMIGRRIDNMDATPLKGAPFCAVIATEHTQVFADGNRIHTTDNSTLCRDSQGRTRREAGLNLLGFTPQKSGTRLITIVDPVAGSRYLLETDNKIARRIAVPSSAGPTVSSANGAGRRCGGSRKRQGRHSAGKRACRRCRPNGCWRTSSQPGPLTSGQSCRC